MTDNKEEIKTEEKKPAPRKVQKPLNPLASKPGQNYGSTKYDKEKPYTEQTSK